MSESKLVNRSSDLLDYCKKIIPIQQLTKEKSPDESIKVIPSVQSQVYSLPLIQISAPKSTSNNSRTSRSQLDILPLPHKNLKKPEKKDLVINSSRAIESRKQSCSSVKYKIVSLSLDKPEKENPKTNAQKKKLNPFDLFPRLKLLFKDSVNLVAERTDRGSAPYQSQTVINSSRIEEGSNSTLTPLVPSILLQAT
jgi:hypothetical protein